MEDLEIIQSNYHVAYRYALIPRNRLEALIDIRRRHTWRTSHANMALRCSADPCTDTRELDIARRFDRMSALYAVLGEYDVKNDCSSERFGLGGLSWPGHQQ